MNPDVSREEFDRTIAEWGSKLTKIMTDGEKLIGQRDICMAENHALKNQIKNLVKENSELRAELKPKEKRLIVLGH